MRWKESALPRVSDGSSKRPCHERSWSLVVRHVGLQRHPDFQIQDHRLDLAVPRHLGELVLLGTRFSSALAILVRQGQQLLYSAPVLCHKARYVKMFGKDKSLGYIKKKNYMTFSVRIHVPSVVLLALPRRLENTPSVR